MTKDVIVRRVAEGHLAEAYAWYEGQAIGLGSHFLTCFESALSQISEFPESCPIVLLDYRRALMPRFPFGVFYVVEQNLVVVAAVFHLARSPQAIQRALKP